MTFKDMPTQVGGGQVRTSQLHDVADWIGTDFRDVQQAVQTSRAEEPLTLAAGRRHEKTVRQRLVILAVQAHQAAQERAVEIVALRQVDDYDTRPALTLEQLNRKLMEGGTVEPCGLTLDLDEKA
jgi:hypothetical protein